MTDADIDRSITAATTANWQKVAKVIRTSVESICEESDHRTDLWKRFGSRVIALVTSGIIEGAGYLEFWRLSEVRLGTGHAKPESPQDSTTAPNGQKTAIGEVFKRARFAAEDAWQTLVAYGEQPTAIQEAAIVQCEAIRRLRHESGFVVLMQFGDGVKIPEGLQFVPACWDYEECDGCGCKIMAGETCWVPSGDSIEIYCAACYAQRSKE